MNTKVNEGKLISGKEALIALANGESVQCANAVTLNWSDVDGDCHIDLFTTAKNRNGFDSVFRLKPRTITINGIEVPAPFEPKEYEDCYMLADLYEHGYTRTSWKYSKSVPAWRTEAEIKQVVVALQNVFKGESR